MKALKVVLFDKTNNVKMDEFSNPGMGTLGLAVDIVNRVLIIETVGKGVKTVTDIAPGDVFELRISEGVEL